jgi:hypothetical protein
MMTRRLWIAAVAALLLIGVGCDKKGKDEPPTLPRPTWRQREVPRPQVLTKEGVRREYLEKGWSGLDDGTKRWVNRLYRTEMAQIHQILSALAGRMRPGNPKYQEVQDLTQLLAAGVSKLGDGDLESDTVRDFQPVIDRSLALLQPAARRGSVPY